MAPITKPAINFTLRFSFAFRTAVEMRDYIIQPVRSVFRLLGAASILVIVALVSALITMQLAVHGREVAVPDFKGKTPSQARAVAEDLGLQAQVEREFYSPSVAGGRVLSQMPEAGTVVRRGWEVRLALSLGPQRVEIPQVVGESERAARINIAQRGLQVGATANVGTSGASFGEVIAQNPPANATGISAPKINLLVAEAPLQFFVMPSFVGQPLGTVTNTLKDAGFTLGKVMIAIPPSVPPTSETPAPQPNGLPESQPSVPAQNPSPASIIVSQDPAAGAKVAAGAAISFTVK
jgi:eukaryotic-like serine/threonine-protein kinase